ncbi:MAG: hypothetical protein KJ607_14525 [Bacteroidetes bacterium]|nr:hypothetical protein [Bacteroidota bacterium]
MKAQKSLSVLHQLRMIIPVAMIACLSAGCRQLLQTARLSECDYTLHSIEKVKLAGIDFEKVSSVTDLGLTDAGKITAAMLTGRLPLDFTANLEITNPNNKPASMSEVYWKVFIDDRQMAEGLVSEKTEIPPDNGKAILPIRVSVNLKEILSGESAVSLVKMAVNWAGLAKSPTKVKLQIKPVFRIGKHEIKSPGYITVKAKY